jgi:hypothetical protein
MVQSRTTYTRLLEGKGLESSFESIGKNLESTEAHNQPSSSHDSANGSASALAAPHTMNIPQPAMSPQPPPSHYPSASLGHLRLFWDPSGRRKWSELAAGNLKEFRAHVDNLA